MLAVEKAYLDKASAGFNEALAETLSITRLLQAADNEPRVHT